MLPMKFKQISKKINVLGVGVSPINQESARIIIGKAIEENTKGYICVTGVHGVMEAQASEGFKKILNNGFLVTPDGMPMVWMGKFFGANEMNRVYGPDLMLNICEAGLEKNYRHFLYGGGDKVAKMLKEKLVKRYPELKIVGTFTPPFRPLNNVEEENLRESVFAAKPDIIWVGLSTPKQERFMAEYIDKLDTTLMFGVGAAFDFHAGLVPQAPAWMQNSGLEWFFRLCKEPRRLWRRYLKNNPLFIWKICMQLCGVRNYSLSHELESRKS